MFVCSCGGGGMSNMLCALFVKCFLLGASSISLVSGAHLRTSGVSSIANGAAAGPAFIVTSGITSTEELCLTVENGAADVEGSEVVLMPCASAIAAGDGRELFNLQQNGQLVNIAGGMCVGLLDNDVASGGRLTTEKCGEAAKNGDGRSTFELQGNGQIKLGRDGHYCLSQRGAPAWHANVALRAAAASTSTADALSHGASMVTDARSETYWASQPGESDGPVEVVIDFGTSVKLQLAEIAWEFPAKAFSIFLSNDGSSWSEAFSTDINMLNTTRVPLGFKFAAKAKVVMREPHPIYGRLYGHRVFGITSLAFIASGLQTIVEECSEAGKSSDARDKFFLTSVGEFDPWPSKALHSEVPALEAARASLAATISELTDALPHIASCDSNAAMVLPKPASRLASRMPLAASRSGLVAHRRAAGVEADEPGGLDFESADLLIQEARSTILQARALLK